MRVGDEVAYRDTLADVVVDAERVPVKSSCARTNHALQLLCVIFQQRNLHAANQSLMGAFGNSTV